MARRKSAFVRGLGGALAGLNEGLQPVLQNQMLMRRQAALQAAQAAAQDERSSLDKLQTLESGLSDRVAAGTLDPAQAQQMAQRAREAFAPRIRKTLLPPVMDFSGMEPSIEDRLSGVLGDVNKAQKPTDVESEGSLTARLASLGIRGDASVGSGEAGSAPFDQEAATQTAQGVRRKKLEAFDAQRVQELADATTRAKNTAYGTGQGTEQATAESFGAGLERKMKDARAMMPIHVEQAGKTAGAEESSREAVYFGNSPKRINEAVQKAMAELGVGEEKEYRAGVLAAGKNAAELRPMLDDLTQTSAKINTREGGLGARITGMVRSGRATMGADPDVRHMQQLQSVILRRLAPAFGIRESNVSGFEEQLIKGGMGLSTFSTAAERRTALRTLYDLVEMSPLVAKVKGSEGDRIAFATNALKMRHDANDQAAQAGATTFLDPITNALIPVIK
jgi:hypothetical protein